MKKRIKLILKKEKIAELSSEESAQIRGGEQQQTYDPCNSYDWCSTIIAAGCGATVSAPDGGGGGPDSYNATCNSMALNC